MFQCQPFHPVHCKIHFKIIKTKIIFGYYFLYLKKCSEYFKAICESILNQKIWKRINPLVFRVLYEIALYSKTAKSFATFTGKHMCWGQFLTNLQTFRPTTLLKRDSSTGAFL